jgi:hypothetical protein
LSIRDEKGRRLDNPRDVVRREIATALKQKKRVIPVLVGRASIPKSQDLPDEISTLFDHKAIEISPERFAFDVERLVQAIGDAYGKVHVFGRGLNSRYVPQMSEIFQVRINGDACAELKGGESVTLQVAAGVHNILIRTPLDKMDRSNEIRKKDELSFSMSSPWSRRRNWR